MFFPPYFSRVATPAPGKFFTFDPQKDIVPLRHAKILVFGIMIYGPFRTFAERLFFTDF